MSYANTDYSGMAWQDAIEYLIQGKSAIMLQGDWVDGWMSALAGKRDLSVIARTAPVGAKTKFVFNCDTWALPKAAPHRQNALDLLRVFGSKKGQEALAPRKGAIAARTDVDLSVFNPYLRSDLADFKAHQSVSQRRAWGGGKRIVESFIPDSNQSLCHHQRRSPRAHRRSGKRL